jgi:hypothetical protein
MAEVRGFMSKKIQIISRITGYCRSDPDSGIFVSDDNSEKDDGKKGPAQNIRGPGIRFPLKVVRIRSPAILQMP